MVSLYLTILRKKVRISRHKLAIVRKKVRIVRFKLAFVREKKTTELWVFFISQFWHYNSVYIPQFWEKNSESQNVNLPLRDKNLIVRIMGLKVTIAYFYFVFSGYLVQQTSIDCYVSHYSNFGILNSIFFWCGIRYEILGKFCYLLIRFYFIEIKFINK